MKRFIKPAIFTFYSYKTSSYFERSGGIEPEITVVHAFKDAG
jgi:hypothetical protein